MSVEQRVQEHYGNADLIDLVDASLRTLGKDPARLVPEDLALIDELHIGGPEATADLIAACGFAAGLNILDVGSGLGGPARAFARKAGVHVTGIDLTAAFVSAARILSERLGLAERTGFQQASALELPFAPQSFDGAYMIHVGMNIGPKEQLFAQVHRVLKPGSTFAIYDIMQVGPGTITFPVPWSTVAETSFVATPEAYESALRAAGFETVAVHDRQAFARVVFDKMAAMQAKGPAPVLQHRGADFALKSRNLRDMVVAGMLGPRILIAKASA